MGVLIGGAAVYMGLTPSESRLGAATSRGVAPREEATQRERTAALPAMDAYAVDEVPQLVDAVALTRDSVVNLQTAAGLGAGVIVDERGIIVTNFHVIADALGSPSLELFGSNPEGGPARVIARFENQREVPATILVADREEDLAVLRLEPEQDGERFAAAQLGRSSELRVGQDVFAVGNPFGLPHTVSRGIVSALDRTGILEPRELPVIQLDASINIGNSGGPLFNLDGALVGIVTARRQHAQGIAFALPIDHVRGFLRAVSEPSMRRSGMMGVTLKLEGGFDPRAKALGYGAGLVLEEVHPGHPADEAGLRSGDVVVELRGKRLDGLKGTATPRELASHLQKTVRSMFSGEQLAVTVVRDGKVREIAVEIGVASERDQALIDAEELLGLELRRNSERPVVENVRSGPLRGFSRFVQGAAITRLMGNDVETLDELGKVLGEIRELTRKHGASLTVPLGLVDAQGRSLPELPLLVQ
jgi:S1-C subfamily serine protease